MTPRPLHQLFDAMYHGKYRFEEFLELKPEEHYSPVRWNRRTIYKPSKKLKEFHSFLNGFLLEHLSVNQSVSFAYRKGATLLQAVVPHSRSRAFYQTDLERFFDSITSDLVRSALESAVTPVSDLTEHIDHILGLLTINGKLPIGYSTSPILSNACLLGFDERLASISKERQWIYTRYADDIIISADDRQAIEGASEVIESCLAAELGDGFTLNPSKSKLTTIGRKVKLLGLVILPNGAIAIDRDVRNKIESWLHFYVSDRSRLAKIFEEERGEGMEEGLQRLSGLVSYAYAADPSYLEKLRAKFGTTVIDSFLHRSAQ
ncbi:RNA-directed DNA polymerase [Azotobacter chroococcum]|uniref:reverse transcriptase domain-containing protein n=1 Tax=Azotobacter chroococcum TaxID=353 RepID=UPI0010402B88|nr:reverse transcriptase domain-containing protein [Azotobacter chroococcum]TBW33924.1 RNA-directed DNA polymerase [Azotobacter chroococcum]